MTRTLLLFLYLLSSIVSVAQAQELRINVVDQSNEPLPGSYIMVNDETVAATDPSGIAFVKLNTLKIGDTISASYITTKDQHITVDSILLRKKELNFIMIENFRSVEANSVTIKANIKKLYRKTLPVLRFPPYKYYGIYTTHFTVDITYPQDSEPTHWVAGRAEGVYSSTFIPEMMQPIIYESVAAHALNPNPIVFDSLMTVHPRVGFVNDLPLKITTADDTTGLTNILMYFLPRALQANNLALQRIADPEPDYIEKRLYPELKMDYVYVGKDPQNIRTFKLDYSGYGAGTTSNVEMKVDSEDYRDRNTLEATINFTDTINNNNYYVKATLKEVNIHELHCIDWGKSAYWQIPVVLESCFKQSDGLIVSVRMSNFYLHSMFEQMNVPFNDIYKRDTLRFKYKRSGDLKHHSLKRFYYDEINYNLNEIISTEERRKARELKKKQKKTSKK